VTVGVNENIAVHDISLCHLKTKSDRWILDSGATAHFTNLANKLINAQPHNGILTVGGGETHLIEKKGDIVLFDESTNETFLLCDVLYCADLTLNIISPRRISSGEFGTIDESGKITLAKIDTFSCQFFFEEGWVTDDAADGYSRLLISKFDAQLGGYSPTARALDQIARYDLNATVASTQRLTELVVTWHKRLGHCGMSQIESYARENGSLPKELQNISTVVKDMPPCRTCVIGNKNKGTFGRSDKAAATAMDVVHIDISGISRIKSRTGFHYFMVFLDDYSRMVWVYFLQDRSKEELEKTIRRFYLIKSPAGERVKKLHGDNEFNQTWFIDMCHQLDITYSFVQPHTPEQNSRAERMMRTLKSPARSMLGASSLPLEFWDFAISTAAFIRCRLSHKRFKISPYERFYGRKPNLSFLRTFGCVCYPHYVKEARQQNKENGAYDPRAQIAIFLAYSHTTMGYYLYLPHSGKFTVSSHVVFDESTTWTWSKAEVLEKRRGWQAYDLWPEENSEKAARFWEDLPEGRLREIDRRGLDELTDKECSKRATESADAIAKEIEAHDALRTDIENAAKEREEKAAEEKAKKEQDEKVLQEEQERKRQESLDSQSKEIDKGGRVQMDFSDSDDDEDQHQLPSPPSTPTIEPQAPLSTDTIPTNDIIDISSDEEEKERQAAEEEIARIEAEETLARDALEREKAEEEETKKRAEEEEKRKKKEEQEAVKQKELNDEVQRKKADRESRRQAAQEQANKDRENTWRSMKASTVVSKAEAMEQLYDLEHRISLLTQGTPSMYQFVESEADIKETCHSIEALENSPQEVYFECEIDDGSEPENHDAFTMHFARSASSRQPGNRATLHGSPTSMYEVRKMEKWPAYFDAMMEEWNCLWAMNTFEYCDALPEGKNLIGCKWVISEKVDIHGNVIRTKARLVAQGYSQIHGIDYQETFSPVIRLTALRLLLTAGIIRGYRVKLLDVKTAYLYGTNEHEIYMTIPVDFRAQDDKRVLKVIKSLYGLKASGREWFKTLSKRLEGHGFEQSMYQDCVFVNRKSGALLLTYVDDIVLLSPDPETESEATKMLMSEFTMTISPPDAAFLGIAMEPLGPNRKGYMLNQKHYINTILKRFGLQDCHSIKRPIAKNDMPKTGPKTFVAEPSSKTEYQCKVGSLMWVSQVTRPDVAHAVHLMARFASNPTTRHHELVDDIFRYLKHTSDLSIVLESSDNPDSILRLEAYSDADWAGDREGGRSTTGYLVRLNGIVVDWKSQLQSTVALSTTDSEVIALSETARNVIGLRHLLQDTFEGVDKGSIIVFTDSNTAIAITKEFGNHDRLRHLNVRYQAIRCYLKEKSIYLARVPTNYNLADPLTKAMEAVKLEQFKSEIGIMRPGLARATRSEVVGHDLAS